MVPLPVASRRLAVPCAIALAALVIALLPARAAVAAPGSPDIIVIVTDDQRADTMRYMPRTLRSVRTRFVNAFVSNPSCCPSRTSMLTGTYSHSNGVWTNGDGEDGTLRGDFGGWSRYAELHLDRSSIAVSLQAAGYRTGHFGKFLNLFDASSAGELPVGWDEFLAVATGEAFAKGRLSPYYDYSLVGTTHGEPFVVEPHGTARGDHSTRVVTKHAIEFIEASGPAPLFLHVGYPAPHSRARRRPPVPMRQDADADVGRLPRLAPSINEEDVSDKPRFVANGDIRPIGEIDRWRRAVARTLLGVDRGIARILEEQRLRDPRLRNTLVIFVSDNGRLHGEHRWAGKGIAYEEAIHVPFLVRWPGLAKGTSETMVSNLDVAATIADVAGIEFSTPDAVSVLDGSRRSITLEGLGVARAYCGIRTQTRKYVRYASGAVEFYDLEHDPFELENQPTSEAAARMYQRAATACASNLPPGWPSDVPY